VSVRRDRAFAAAGVGVLVVALFSDAVVKGRVFYERDLQLDWYTQMEAFVRSVAAGSWPVWDNTIAFGQPLLADPSAQILYPLTWLNLALQPWRYYTVFVVFHACFGCFGVLRLCRCLRVAPLGSLVAAALWVCSGPVLSMLNTWQHFAGAAWLAWVLVATHDACESPGTSRSVAWALTVTGQVLAGSADICAMSGLLMAGYVATRIEWRGLASSWNRRLLACAGVAALLTLSLSAAVWLPVLDVARHSSRWNYPEDVRTAWSLQPASLAGTLLPVRVEDLSQVLPGRLAPAAEARDPLLPSLYFGLATVPLVARALFSGRKGSVLLAAACAVSLLTSVGSHSGFYGLLIRSVPMLGIFRYPSKAMIVAAFAWALLAGIGLEVHRERSSGHRASLVAWMAGVATLAALGMRLPAGEMRDRWIVAMACAACSALALLSARARTGLSAGWAAAAALAAIADTFLAHHGMNRTAPAELLAFRPPAVDAVATTDRSRLYVYDYMAPGKSRRYLKRDDPYMIRRPPNHASLERIQVLSQRLYLFPPVGGRWGLEGSFDLDFRGLYPHELARLVHLLRDVETTPGHLRLLRIGAVATVMSLHTRGLEDLIAAGTLPSYFPEAIHVLRVPDPLPRTYAVGTARQVDDAAALRTLLDPGFDPLREITLPSTTPVASSSRFSGSSRIVEFKPDRVRLEAQLDARGYVVLVDSYDPGWRAHVDGAPTPLLRANVAFRAVEVPAGRHSIEFVYRPRAVSWGLGLSGLGITCAFLLYVWSRAARR